jgi:hypothetical protein
VNLSLRTRKVILHRKTIQFNYARGQSTPETSLAQQRQVEFHLPEKVASGAAAEFAASQHQDSPFGRI